MLGSHDRTNIRSCIVLRSGQWHKVEGIVGTWRESEVYSLTSVHRLMPKTVFASEVRPS